MEAENWEFTEGRQHSLKVAQQVHSAAVHVGLKHPKELKKELKRLARARREKQGR